MNLALGSRVIIVRGPLVGQPGILLNRFYTGVQVLLDDGHRIWMEDAKVEELRIDGDDDEMGEVPV